MRSVLLAHLSRGLLLVFVFFFFFQAEDGIRDLYVTRVQTCALPILRCSLPPRHSSSSAGFPTRSGGSRLFSRGLPLQPSRTIRCTRRSATPRTRPTRITHWRDRKSVV